MAETAENGEAAGIEFRLLGAIAATRDGTGLRLGGPRQRAVLALLLLDANRRPAGRDGVGGAASARRQDDRLRLSPPSSARTGRVRGDGGHILITRDSGYVLAVDRAHLDASVFGEQFHAGCAAAADGRPAEAAGQLRDALALWRGRALEDLADYPFTGGDPAGRTTRRCAGSSGRRRPLIYLMRHAVVAVRGHRAQPGKGRPECQRWRRPDSRILIEKPFGWDEPGAKDLYRPCPASRARAGNRFRSVRSPEAPIITNAQGGDRRSATSAPADPTTLAPGCGGMDGPHRRPMPRREPHALDATIVSGSCTSAAPSNSGGGRWNSLVR